MSRIKKFIFDLRSTYSFHNSRDGRAETQATILCFYFFNVPRPSLATGAYGVVSSGNILKLLQTNVYFLDVSISYRIGKS